MANKKFSRLPNDYEITLPEHAEVQLDEADDGTIEAQKFTLATFDTLDDLTTEAYVDIIGIVTFVQPATEIQSKAGKKLLKRTITLMDKSIRKNPDAKVRGMVDETVYNTVNLTIWGEKATEFDEVKLADFPVLAVKCVRVSDFGGRSLNSTFGSQFLLHPDVPEAHNLRQWYDTEGRDAKSQSLSTGGGHYPRKQLIAIKEEKLGKDQKKPDYFKVRATITFIKRDWLQQPPWYMACPNKECNKKLTGGQHDGGWFCANQNCPYQRENKIVDNPVPRYMLSVLCCDATGSEWLTAFNEQAQDILGGLPCEELVKIRNEERDEAKFEDVFQKANFQTFTFNLRAKPAYIQDQWQPRCHITYATRVDFVRESAYLLGEINRFG